jgi:hypothetical protein
MPVQAEHARFRGIPLPPSGWTLAVLLALYICTGLIGHDPWKNDDAVTIGVVHDMVANGNWLTPGLAGRPYPDAPLYYWVAAAGSRLLSWLLPVHEATRLASGVFTLLALGFIHLAARELHGREQAPAAPLLLAGSIGFLFHAHEAQPMLATLTAHTAAYWGLTQLDRRPLRGASWFGSALGLGLSRQRPGSDAAAVAGGSVCGLAIRPSPTFSAAAAWLAAACLCACRRMAGCLVRDLARVPRRLLAGRAKPTRRQHATPAEYTTPSADAPVVRMASLPSRLLDTLGKAPPIGNDPAGLADVRLHGCTAGGQHLPWGTQCASLAAAAATGSAGRSGRRFAATRRGECF